MKNDAKTIDELADLSINPKLFYELLKIIRDITKEDGTLESIGEARGIGFKYFPYKNTCFDGMYPMIAITAQKNTINIYVSKYEDGESVVQKYGTDFGKSNIGKSCIRIKTMNDKKYDALNTILLKSV